jgi:hypothetical protein
MSRCGAALGWCTGLQLGLQLHCGLDAAVGVGSVAAAGAVC